MTKNYLDPRYYRYIEPCADLNISQYGDCCLDVHLKNHSMLIGRGRGAWWIIWIAVFAYLFFLIGGIIGGMNIVEVLLVPLGVALLLAVPILIWAYYVGNNQRPVRFCRKNRKFYVYIKKQLFTQDWDKIRAYAASQGGFSATGAPYSDEQLQIELGEGENRLTIFLYGTAESKSNIPKHQEALALWEYIRSYMDNGPEELPAPNPRIPYVDLATIFAETNPFPIAGRSNDAFWKMFSTFLFPLRVVWFLITYPAEVLYYYFHQKFIHPKPFPEEFNIPPINDCGLEEKEAPGYTQEEMDIILEGIEEGDLRQKMIKKMKEKPNFRYINYEAATDEQRARIDKDQEALRKSST